MIEFNNCKYRRRPHSTFNFHKEIGYSRSSRMPINVPSRGALYGTLKFQVLGKVLALCVIPQLCARTLRLPLTTS